MKVFCRKFVLIWTFSFYEYLTGFVCNFYKILVKYYYYYYYCYYHCYFIFNQYELVLIEMSKAFFLIKTIFLIEINRNL